MSAKDVLRTLDALAAMSYFDVVAQLEKAAGRKLTAEERDAAALELGGLPAPSAVVDLTGKPPLPPGHPDRGGFL